MLIVISRASPRLRRHANMIRGIDLSPNETLATCVRSGGTAARLSTLLGLSVIRLGGATLSWGDADVIVRNGLAPDKPLLARVGARGLRLGNDKNGSGWMNFYQFVPVMGVDKHDAFGPDVLIGPRIR